MLHGHVLILKAQKNIINVGLWLQKCNVEEQVVQEGRIRGVYWSVSTSAYWKKIKKTACYCKASSPMAVKWKKI